MDSILLIVGALLYFLMVPLIFGYLMERVDEGKMSKVVLYLLIFLLWVIPIICSALFMEDSIVFLISYAVLTILCVIIVLLRLFI